MQSSSRPFDSIVSVFSEEMLPKEVRPRLERLFRELDRSLFLDNTSEVAVDRDTLIRIASDEDLVPASHRDLLVLETSKHLGRRIKKFGQGRRIPWQDGEKYGLPIHIPSASELQELGITKKASIENLEAALHEAFPEVPEDWAEVTPDTFLKAFLVNRSAWDCLVANLGWFAAFLVVGTLVIGGILLASGVPWQVILAVLIAYSGALTAYVMAQCLLHPEFQQF